MSLPRLTVLAFALGLAALTACDDDGGKPAADTTGGDQGAQDAKDTTGTDGAAEDTTADTGPSCTELGDKIIGAECASHCECETGYCYDEAYMAPFRFCTKPCQDGCNAGGPDLHVCLTFTQAQIAAHGLKQTHVCQRRCTIDGDCAALSEAYDTCGTGGLTKWENSTIGGKSCQISGSID